MVKFWVWTSEFIFLSQINLILPALRDKRLLAILVARYLLNIILVAWLYTTLPWVFLFVALFVNFKLYGYQVRNFDQDDALTFNAQVSEFIAFFSIVNFVFAFPFWGDPNKAISRSLHRLINLVGVGAVIYSIVIHKLHDGWSCYNSAVFPHKTDYIYGMCPLDLADQTEPICGRHVGIHCDERELLKNGQLFYEIAVSLVTSSGVLYIIGCPFF